MPSTQAGAPQPATQDRESTEPSTTSDRVRQLEQRVAELERERQHLVAAVDILLEVSRSLHFADILQTVARKLGGTFGLDRCSIFLAGHDQDVRLVATYEDPTIRNLIVDLDRYPELRQAFDSGETVHIPEATADPRLQEVHHMLASRNVQSIIVVPIRWRGTMIGAIFLRTERDGLPFSDADVRFCQVIAALTANALRNAHRFEALLRAQQGRSRDERRRELQRIALVAFVRRLVDRYTRTDDHMWAETLLPGSADEELERLVSVVMEVMSTEAEESTVPQRRVEVA
ncbi:MAG TPA: GAF domain-containing protein [Gemmatimonadaceae bacterium]|nr:GAF domain-containing protein [Gemmatimonadaceae bacterium]